MAFHDLCDEWTILFLDDKMNKLPQKDCLNIKADLENRIKKLRYGSNIRYDNNFKLNDKNGLLYGDQYSCPKGSPFPKAMNDILMLCQDYALEKHLNVIAQIFVTAIELGNPVSIWKQAIVIYRQTSEADVLVYDDHDEDELFYTDIEKKNKIEKWDVQDHLWDMLMDNFRKTPWKKDKNGDMTKEAEKLYNKITQYISKEFFYL